MGLGTSPTKSLAIDALHCVYYGPIMRWVGSALWRTVLHNPWKFRGGPEAIIELGSRRLEAD
eukprot:14772-Pyramimonas_sp.AAC.1